MSLKIDHIANSVTVVNCCLDYLDWYIQFKRSQYSENFTRISQECHENFTRISSECHENLTRILRVFHENFTKISREYSNSQMISLSLKVVGGQFTTTYYRDLPSSIYGNSSFKIEILQRPIVQSGHPSSCQSISFI